MEVNSCNFKLENPLTGFYKNKTKAVLLAHGLIGTVRGKSANGLMMHSKLFDIVGIIDRDAVGKNTAEICPGVKIKVPIYKDFTSSENDNNAEVLILLIPPTKENYIDIENAINSGIDIINTSFTFIKNDHYIIRLTEINGVMFFDLRDVTHLQVYPDTKILKRKAKVVFVTGTDCGLGKRTAAYELTQEAKKHGINAVMYATGQTGLMLGERGTVVDSLVTEFSNGVVSQHITRFDEEGYELIFVEGQSDIFHPANSAMSLALLHGANPDCIVLVHDEKRKYHKGFDEESPLYKMHPLKNYIKVIEMLSLPCGPIYKTVGIATIGNDNIEIINNILKNSTAVADVRKPGGPAIILDAVLQHLESIYDWIPECYSLIK